MSAAAYVLPFAHQHTPSTGTATVALHCVGVIQFVPLHVHVATQFETW